MVKYRGPICWWLSVLVVLMALGASLWPAWAFIPKATAPKLQSRKNESAASVMSKRGDLGGDMTLLAHFYTPPVGLGESNHFIDMWSGGQMAEFVRGHGLTNNRALFIISHARGRTSGGKWRYALYPAESEVKPGAKTPYYSPQDIARVLGRGVIDQIDNLIISGCNAENLLDLSEWRACFPSATNIIHAAAGRDGYDFLLRHALLYRSPEIKWLYETPESFSLEGAEDKKNQAKKPPKLNLYLASLYRPGANQPYRVQTAGRELLESDKGTQTTAIAAKAPQPLSAQPKPTPPTLAPRAANPASARAPIVMRANDRAKPLPAAPANFPKLAYAAATFGVLALIFGIWWLILEFRIASARMSGIDDDANPPGLAEPSVERTQTRIRITLRPKN
jgi:hypothetical protein